MDRHDNSEPSMELRRQVEALAGNPRITMLNSQGELIVTTGGIDKIVFDGCSLEIELDPMGSNKHRNHEQYGSGGIKVSIIISNGGYFHILCYSGSDSDRDSDDDSASDDDNA